MRCVPAWYHAAFFLAALALPLFGQGTDPTAATSTRPASARSADTRPAASQPMTFEAHATPGPELPIPEIEINRKTVCSFDVHGPVWDGVNNGLWIVLQDFNLRDVVRGGRLPRWDDPTVAVLIDPATGKEMRRLDAPNSGLIGHDGVGLWFEMFAQSAVTEKDESVLQRVRTAPGLQQDREETDAGLPEDLPARIRLASLHLASQVTSPSIFSIPRVIVRGDVLGTKYLARWFLDSGTIVVCSRWGSSGSGDKFHRPDTPMATGGDYLWVFTDQLQRFPLSEIEPVKAKGVLNGPWDFEEANIPGLRDGLKWMSAGLDKVEVRGSLAWDGQRLWSLDKRSAKEGVAYLYPQFRTRRFPGVSIILPPVRLVSIDVGLSRKPDTTDRHNKALAFERKNGTLKAIPLFEELIAYDPAAVEIRNHLAWALATRPQEPYHDIQRAKKLVEGALEWQPWNPEFWDTLAEIYWRLGDAKLAERLEAKAINLNPAKTFYWKQLDKFRAGPATQMAPEPAY
jgi:hypothetical protein